MYPHIPQSWTQATTLTRLESSGCRLQAMSVLQAFPRLKVLKISM